MPNDPIYNLMRHGFPRESLDDKSYKTTIEYVGLVTLLLLHSPAISTQWGKYPGLVTEQNLERLEGTAHGILTITCESKFNTGGDSPKTGKKIEGETSYEIDWVDVQRSLYEHPKFRKGGGGAYELTDADIENIKNWEKNPWAAYKKIYTYRDGGDYTKACDASDPTLSINAKTLAVALYHGVQYWIEKAPVARRSDTWVNGPPPPGSAGQKQTPPGFPNLPTGYEWIRSTDRALRAGGQSSWSNDTEWIGANKVLIDVDEIFWNPPS